MHPREIEHGLGWGCPTWRIHFRVAVFSCVTLACPLPLSEPQCPHLSMGPVTEPTLWVVMRFLGQSWEEFGMVSRTEYVQNSY